MAVPPLNLAVAAATAVPLCLAVAGVVGFPLYLAVAVVMAFLLCLAVSVVMGVPLYLAVAAAVVFPPFSVVAEAVVPGVPFSVALAGGSACLYLAAAGGPVEAAVNRAFRFSEGAMLVGVLRFLVAEAVEFSPRSLEAEAAVTATTAVAPPSWEVAVASHLREAVFHSWAAATGTGRPSSGEATGLRWALGVFPTCSGVGTVDPALAGGLALFSEEAGRVEEVVGCCLVCQICRRCLVC